jgi:hypothetical protein
MSGDFVRISLFDPRAAPFEEDQWVGGVLRFGDADDAPAVAVTLRDGEHRS